MINELKNHGGKSGPAFDTPETYSINSVGSANILHSQHESPELNM
jgi:hypothetical protein